MQHILLVEDDDLLRELLEMTLSIEGYTVTPAAHGVEGIECLRREHFDLVLLDLMMPFMDGLRFLNIVAAEVPVPPPVIVMSAYGAGALARDVLDVGAEAVVRKPVDTAELLDTITRVLQASANN